MAVTFNADEIFEMAEEIERNAEKFYREAAEKATDKKTSQMFLDLAAMEDGHLITFQHMRKQLRGKENEPTVFDPEDEAAMYLQTMAGVHGIEGKITHTRKLTGNEKMEDIYKIAIDAEKNSIVFYVGLRNFVPAGAGRDKVEGIIREEMSHLTILSRSLASMRG